jgi:hypothetical protein
LFFPPLGVNDDGILLAISQRSYHSSIYRVGRWIVD